MRIFAWLITAMLLLAPEVCGYEALDFAFLLSAHASAEGSTIVITWPRQNVRSITVQRKLVSEKAMERIDRAPAGRRDQF
jgi:hypothetical protein